MPDVAGKRCADAALHEAQESFRRSFEDAQIGMMTIDLDGRYRLLNDAFCRLVGHRRESLVGQLRECITHPDDIVADAAALRSLLAGEATSHTREKRYVHRAGHVVWAQITITLIRSADAAPLRFIAHVLDIGDRRNYEDSLRHLAEHDPLTGLLNRRIFEDKLASHVARTRRYGAAGALMLLDLDRFKIYNDRHGHPAGDELLVRIAHALQSRVRESDVLSRLGGDEFAVLLPHGDEDEIRAVAEALLALVRDETASGPISPGPQVTASVGIARFDDDEDLTAEEVTVNADLAMYDAKARGGDAWARYRATAHHATNRGSHTQWDQTIRYALTHDGLELLAQPVVAFVRDGPPQYELLLRMRDRQGQTIMPGSFLHIAERLGLIGAIDRWVVGRAIDMLVEQRALARDLRFEINLSSSAIGDAQLMALIERRLLENAVSPGGLIFEVAEIAAVAHFARTAAFARRLSELGCHFALDNFGAGLGSFYYLKRLPCDYLKFDGEFVAHCVDSQMDRTLIAAMTQIARATGRRTIAAYVTGQPCAHVLAGLGVDYGQGFYLGQPAPLVEHLAAADACASVQIEMNAIRRSER